MLRLVIGRLLVPFALAAGLASDTTGAELTTAAAVRSLADAREFQPHPVRLQGVVLLPPSPGGNSFVLADDTACIYVEADPAQCAALERGVVAAIRGLAMQRRFAPFVTAEAVSVQGTGVIPPPKGVEFGDLLTGQHDAQWVEISGTVRRVEAGGVMELAADGGRLRVQCRKTGAVQIPVDADVRVLGVVFYQFSRSGQMIRPMLIVPDLQAIEIAIPPPAEIPLKRIDRLLSFSADGSFGHRVKVHGVVTHQLPGEALWLEEDGRAVRVNLDDSRIYVPGEALEVAGFVRLGGYSPEMEDVQVTRLAFGTLPSPTLLESPAAAPDYDAGLVTLRGRLIEKTRVPEGLKLVFSSHNHDFPALLKHSGTKVSFIDLWEVGSLMNVTGICGVSRLHETTHPGTVEPTEFDLIMRSAADIVVLERPPWWNVQRRAWALAALGLALGMIAIVTVWRSRRKLRQTAAARRQSEAEFAAILAERNRIAREIHDTLAQDLGAILLQHEMLKDLVPVGSEAQAHLIEANVITRGALAEARESIWNMRSQALEDHGLGGALAGILDQLTDNEGTEAAIEITGEPFLLPPMVENNLLRIGQEAITNAVKHAAARRIDVLLEYAPNHVILRVQDDGHGFDPRAVHPEDRHFGLVGMRERATELGAKLRLDSSPKHGTLLILELPIPDQG
jgi:signal transduction histidine kinase